MKYTTLLLIVIMVVLSVWDSEAQSGAARGRARMRGTVTDAQGNPLEGVTVHFSSERLQTGFDVLTNEKGEWVAAGIAGGEWNIDFTLAGYKPRSISYGVSTLGFNKPVELALEKSGNGTPKGQVKGLDLVQEGDRLRREKDPLGAIAKYEEAIRVNPSLVRLEVEIGRLYAEADRDDEAIGVFRKILNRDETDQDARIALATLLLKKKEIAEAKEVLSKLNLESVSNANALYNLGAGFHNLNQTDEAVKYFLLAASADPAMSDAHFQLGIAYMSLGQEQKAREEFEKVIEIASNSENARLAREMIASIPN